MKLFTFLALIAAIYSGNTHAALIGEDTVTLGKKGSVANKTVKMGAGRIIWSQSDSKMKFSNNSGSTLKDIGSGGGGAAGITLLNDVNFDFEGDTTSWTASGGAFSIATAGSNHLFDVKSGVFNSSAGAQTLTNALVSVPDGLKGASGAASCFFKTTASDYKLQVYDGTNVLSEKVIPASALALKTSLSFVFPAASQVQLRIISQSDAADLAIDNCFLGEQVLTQIGTAKYFGGIKLTGGSCTFVTSSGSYADFSASTCTYAAKGGASAPATQIPAIKFASFPAGEYYFVARGTMAGVNSSGDTSTCGVQFHDGTTSGGDSSIGIIAGGAATAYGYTATMTGHFSALTSSANKQISMQMKAIGAGTTCVIDTSASQPFTIDVYQYPSASSQAISVNQVPASWSGYQTVASGWSTASATYADLAVGGSIVLTETTNRNFGTVTSAGSSLPGVTFSPSITGVYHVCAQSVMVGSTASTPSLRLVDGSAVVIHPGASAASNTTAVPLSLCGDYRVLAVGSPITVKLQGATDAGTMSIQNGSATGSAAIQWTISNADFNSAAPFLVGGIVGSGTGSVEKMLRVKVTPSCTSSPCTITDQSGGVSGIVRNSQGNYTATFSAGVFSATPTCVIGVSDTTAVTAKPIGSPSSTALNFTTSDQTPAVQDSGFSLLCQGPQ